MKIVYLLSLEYLMEIFNGVSFMVMETANLWGVLKQFSASVSDCHCALQNFSILESFNSCNFLF